MSGRTRTAQCTTPRRNLARVVGALASRATRTSLIVAALAVSMGCESTARTEPGCEEAAARLVELRLEDVAAGGVDLARHRANLERATGAAQLETCRNHYEPADVRCVLAAQTSDAAAECLSTLADRGMGGRRDATN